MTDDIFRIKIKGKRHQGTDYILSKMAFVCVWLRSPRVNSNGNDGVADVRTDATIDANNNYATKVNGLRPIYSACYQEFVTRVTNVLF